MIEIIEERSIPHLPDYFTRALENFDSTLCLQWSGRFWQIWRNAPSGRRLHIINIERDGRYVEPGDWVFHLLHKIDMARFPGGVTEFLNKLDQENEERERRQEAHNYDEQVEATKDAIWSKTMKELEAI